MKLFFVEKDYRLFIDSGIVYIILLSSETHNSDVFVLYF